jgi:hypothetical protein
VSRRLLTIGAYGFGPDEFFSALENAGADVFLDIRQRRGLRGSRYAGVANPPHRIARDTLVRVSLARWHDPASAPAGYYTQISGVY